jgi:hypothetical protein
MLRREKKKDQVKAVVGLSIADHVDGVGGRA